MVNIGGFDTGGIGGVLLGWATSIFFWVLVMAGFFILVLVLLTIRKRRRFEFPCLEVIGFGRGKIRVNTTKAGWFKNKKMFFGLYDYGGEDELLCKGGFLRKDRRIESASSTDYHEINGKRGIIAKRKDDDPSILVPISKFKITNPELLAKIAPADYRDAGVKIYNERKKETMSWWDENKSTILMAGVILFAVIAIIFVIRFAQNESSAWRETALKIMTNLGTAPSSAP